jgi:alpha-tubulin suppressor-like RCC1 family protein
VLDVSFGFDHSLFLVETIDKAREVYSCGGSKHGECGLGEAIYRAMP